MAKSKILIAGRGPLALAAIRAARQLGLKTVAVYASPDQKALHVQLADEAVHVGPADLADSYLNQEALLTVAKLHQIQYIYPLFSALANDMAFIKRAKALNFVVVGPSANALEQLSQQGPSAEPDESAQRTSWPFFVDNDGRLTILAQVQLPARDDPAPIMKGRPWQDTDAAHPDSALHQLSQLLAGSGFLGLGTATVAEKTPGAADDQVSVTAGPSQVTQMAESLYDVDLMKSQLQLTLGTATAFVRPVERVARVWAAGITAADSGQVSGLYLPTGLGLRVETQLYQGLVVTGSYSQALAVIFAVGHSDEQASQRLLAAIDETVIKGVATNLDDLAKGLALPAART